MGNKLYEEEDVRGIATAIRNKTGSTDTYTISQMASAIDAIETGSGGGGGTDSEVELLKTIISGGAVTNFDSDVSKIRPYLFYSDNNLKSVNIPNVTEIGAAAFQSVSFNSGTFYAPNATTIGASAFRSFGCFSIELPNAISIGASAFSYSSAVNINIPNASSLGTNVFDSAYRLESIELRNVVDIKDYTFSSCGQITSIIIPNATTIGRRAFYGCSKLKSIDLPKAVSLGVDSFLSTTAMTDIWLRNEDAVCTYSTTSSSNDPKNANLKIHVPAALLDQYKTATNWVRLASKFVAIEEGE